MTQLPDRDAVERPRLSQAVVLSEAVSLADREGLAAVTIRRLAKDLGVTPMALYWHFRDKGLLMAALGDRILGEVDLAVDGRARWSEQFHRVLTALVTALRKHPWAGALITSSACESPVTWPRWKRCWRSCGARGSPPRKRPIFPATRSAR